MSSLLFLLDVIAFLVVVQWAVAHQASSASGASGLLGMHDKASDEAARAERSKPRWARGAPSNAAPSSRPASGTLAPQPGWRRTLR